MDRTLPTLVFVLGVSLTVASTADELLGAALRATLSLLLSVATLALAQPVARGWARVQAGQT